MILFEKEPKYHSDSLPVFCGERIQKLFNVYLIFSLRAAQVISAQLYCVMYSPA